MKIYTNSGKLGWDHTGASQCKNIYQLCFNALILLQVCAVERKEHVAHTWAGIKKATGSDAKSRKIKEGWYDAQDDPSTITVETVNHIWQINSGSAFGRVSWDAGFVGVACVKAGALAKVNFAVFFLKGRQVNDQTGDSGEWERDCTASAADRTGEGQTRSLEEEHIWTCLLVRAESWYTI